MIFGYFKRRRIYIFKRKKSILLIDKPQVMVTHKKKYIDFNILKLKKTLTPFQT